jgi:uncharacterized protein (DUF1778 family)
VSGRVALSERERFADPKPGSPQGHDERAKALSVRAIADDPHDGDDLLDRRRPAAGIPWFLPWLGWLDNPQLYCHCKYMSTVKEERLQIRVDPSDKALLERAAAASHLNVSAFVIQAAASKAEEILAERSSIRLSHEAAVAFSEALERPAEVNDRLAQALRRKRKFSWLD